MLFKILFTPRAREELRSFRKNEQKRIVEAMETRLLHEPIRETRNRKRLRPNELAEWELRAGDLRVFYDTDADTVKIIALGRKTGNRLLINGKEFGL